jgi:hypothetical protein
VGLAQRELEKRGLVTVSLTNMPFITAKIGVPRAVAVEFPFGMIWGHPGDHAMHERIMRHLLEAAESIEQPGTIVELPYEWPEEDFKKRDWFPEEKPPWLSSQENIDEMIAFIREGYPLE